MDERSSPLSNAHGGPKLRALGREQTDAVGLARHATGMLIRGHAS